MTWLLFLSARESIIFVSLCFTSLFWFYSPQLHCFGTNSEWIWFPFHTNAGILQNELFPVSNGILTGFHVFVCACKTSIWKQWLLAEKCRFLWLVCTNRSRLNLQLNSVLLHQHSQSAILLGPQCSSLTDHWCRLYLHLLALHSCYSICSLF